MATRQLPRLPSQRKNDKQEFVASRVYVNPRTASRTPHLCCNGYPKTHEPRYGFAPIRSAESVLLSRCDQPQTVSLQGPIFVRRNLSQVMELVHDLVMLNVSLDV